MRLLDQATVGIALGVGVLALSAASASAEIACRRNVCWHVNERYEYPAEARVIIHPDNWHWGRNEHYAWREHEGRGYWRGGRWIER
jgi:hypothetical protein